MKHAMGWGILVVLLLCSTAAAMERFDIVTTDQMKQMIEDRAAGKTDFILVNALDEIIYMHASIPGSVNLPWSRIDALQERLGSDRERLVVTYCMGYR